MIKQWHVRHYESNRDNKFVVRLHEGELIDSYFSSNRSALLEKVLNRELPEGKLRKRKAKKAKVI